MTASDNARDSSKFKSFVARNFNFKKWADWDRSQSMTNYFLGVIRFFFIPKAKDKGPIKPFEEVIAEMKMKDDEIQKQGNALRNLARWSLCFAFVLYVYVMYQLVYGGVLAVVLGTILIFVTLAIAFRYHFWYFQIKQRKLGCTIREWFKGTFMGGNE